MQERVTFLSFLHFDSCISFGADLRWFIRLLPAPDRQCKLFTFCTLAKISTFARRRATHRLVTINQYNRSSIWEFTQMFAEGPDGGWHLSQKPGKLSVSAFTVAELGEMLPKIAIPDTNYYGSKTGDGRWEVGYVFMDGSGIWHLEVGLTGANAGKFTVRPDFDSYKYI